MKPSRVHDHLVDDHVTRYRRDGWDAVVLRQRPIPLIRVNKPGRIRTDEFTRPGNWTLVDAKPMPWRNASWPDVPVSRLLLDVPKDDDVLMPRHPPLYADPEANRKWNLECALRLHELERGGHRWIRLWRLVNGYISVVRPDAFLFKDDRAIALVVTTNRSAVKVDRLRDFDEVHVVVHKPSLVFLPENPPPAAFHRIAPKQPTLA